MIKFPVPVLCEDKDKSSYVDYFFISILNLENSIVLDSGRLILNLNVSTNIFESGYFRSNQVKYMVKVYTELRTIVFISDTPIFERNIDENELVNNEKIELKAFVILKEKVFFKNNGHLFEFYSPENTFEVDESFVVAETNSNFFWYQRTGESFFLMSESNDLKGNGLSVSSVHQNHIIILLEPDLHKSIIKLNTRDNPYSKFIISSILLQTISIILTELSDAYLNHKLENYKERKWFKLLSIASERTTGFNLEELLDEIVTDSIDTNRILRESQKILNNNFSTNLMKISSAKRGAYEI